VYALPQTIAALRTHIFNGVIWPDFSRLPSVERPVLEFVAIETGATVELSGARQIEVLPAAHTVPAVGYAVHSATMDGVWIYTGDTGPNAALWERLAALKVRALVIETAFSDEEHALARISQHLCPKDLGSELQRLAGAVDVFITHIKPGEVQAVMNEIGQLNGPHRIRALAAGRVMRFGTAAASS
jgi:ribonuclease BN (tRNA processing enzyme)